MRAWRGDFYINSYVKPRLLTHDPARIAAYKTDPLIARQIAVNVLLGLYETAERVVADARAIVIPTQLLIAGSDWVVEAWPPHRFFERLGPPLKEGHVLPGFFAGVPREKARTVTIAHV